MGVADCFPVKANEHSTGNVQAEVTMKDLFQ
jgi:hypothetical protein